MNKKKTTLVVALVILGVAVLGLAAAVYAKYASTVTSGNGSLTVAKWSFEEDNKNETITCDLTKNYDDNTLVDGKIAPGTSGTCTISLSNANTEVGVNYVIKVKTITGAPANMKFYKEADHTNVVDTETGIAGTLAPKAAAQDVEIYWQWPYETPADSDDGDVADTTAGKNAGSLSVSFEISGTQVRPTPADQ